MAIRPYHPTWTSASALQAVISAAATDSPLSQLDQYRMELEFSLAFRRSLFVNLCFLQGWLPMTSLQHTNGPLADFFISHDGFAYIPFEPADTQFRRLCSERRWDEHGEKKARRLYRNALVKQFNISYGTDETSLDNWRRLCAYLGFFPLPNTIEDCRLVVLHTHVNLVDLVDAFSQGVFVTVFRTVHELSFYTKSTNKVFPRKNIHAGNLLKYLLRHIINPDLDDTEERCDRKGLRDRSLVGR